MSFRNYPSTENTYFYTVRYDGDHNVAFQSDTALDSNEEVETLCKQQGILEEGSKVEAVRPLSKVEFLLLKALSGQ